MLWYAGGVSPLSRTWCRQTSCFVCRCYGGFITSPTDRCSSHDQTEDGRRDKYTGVQSLRSPLPFARRSAPPSQLNHRVYVSRCARHDAGGGYGMRHKTRCSFGPTAKQDSMLCRVHAVPYYCSPTTPPRSKHTNNSSSRTSSETRRCSFFSLVVILSLVFGLCFFASILSAFQVCFHSQPFFARARIPPSTSLRALPVPQRSGRAASAGRGGDDGCDITFEPRRGGVHRGAPQVSCR